MWHETHANFFGTLAVLATRLEVLIPSLTGTPALGRRRALVPDGDCGPVTSAIQQTRERMRSLRPRVGTGLASAMFNLAHTKATKDIVVALRISYSD